MICEPIAHYTADDGVTTDSYGSVTGFDGYVFEWKNKISDNYHLFRQDLGAPQNTNTFPPIVGSDNRGSYIDFDRSIFETFSSGLYNTTLGSVFESPYTIAVVIHTDTNKQFNVFNAGAEDDSPILYGKYLYGNPNPNPNVIYSRTGMGGSTNNIHILKNAGSLKGLILICGMDEYLEFALSNGVGSSGMVLGLTSLDMFYFGGVSGKIREVLVYDKCLLNVKDQVRDLLNDLGNKYNYNIYPY